MSSSAQGQEAASTGKHQGRRAVHKAFKESEEETVV